MPEVIPSTPGYIYPLGETDVLEFRLFPDEMDMELATGGGSESHPSYGHSVTQLTGRSSPSFSFSVIFDGLETTEHHYAHGGTQIDPSDRWSRAAPGMVNQEDNPAHQAYLWFMRHIGPSGAGASKDRAKVFVMRLWQNEPQLVRFTSVKVKPTFVSSSYGDEGIIRRFRASVSGEYFYPVVVDKRAFTRRPKKAKKKDEKGAYEEYDDRFLRMTELANSTLSSEDQEKLKAAEQRGEFRTSIDVETPEVDQTRGSNTVTTTIPGTNATADIRISPYTRRPADSRSAPPSGWVDAASKKSDVVASKVSKPKIFVPKDYKPVPYVD